MQVKFIHGGELIEVVTANDSRELEAVESIATANKMRWENKRQVVSSSICMFKNYTYLPGGLWRRLESLRNEGFDIEFINNYPESAITRDAIDKFITGRGYKFELEEHQLEAVYNALRYKRACEIIGTSGGKTFITMCLASILLYGNAYKTDKKFLVVVPSQMLCDQGLNDFEDYQSTLDVPHLKVNKIYSNARNKYSFDECNVVFGTYQTIQNMPTDWFKQFTAVFIDEAHRAIDAVTSFLPNLRHCEYRFALSGSMPPEHSYEFLMLESMIGALSYTFKTKDLRDAGFTADFIIKRLRFIHSAESTREFYETIKYETNIRTEYNKLLDTITEDNKKHPENRMLIEERNIITARLDELFQQKAHKDFNRRLFEEEWLFNNQKRLETIASVIAGLDKNTLTLARRKREVLGIYEKLKDVSKRSVHVIVGGVNNKQEIVSTIKNGDSAESDLVGNVDMIGTGVSINNLFYGIFCGIGKSFYTALQTAGRMIRKHKDKSKAVIIDTHDVMLCDVKGVRTHHKKSYSSAHADERLNIYKNEEFEYSEEIIDIYVH